MRYTYFLTAIFTVALFTACGEQPASNTANTTNTANTNAAPEKTVLAEGEVPQHIKDMMATRGEQDQAAPTVKITAPADGSVVESSTVRVMVELSGDLKGYKPGMDHEIKMGNHIHVILDNQPYEAYYNIDREFELRNVPNGENKLRVFALLPWTQRYNNAGSSSMV